MQSAPPLRPHGFWCTCKPFPKIWVANLVFSSTSPACFKQSWAEVAFWLWAGARNSFMWMLSVIYGWQQKHGAGVRDTSREKETERSRVEFSRFPSLQGSYRSLLRQVLKLVIRVFSSARISTCAVRSKRDVMFLPPVASQMTIFHSWMFYIVRKLCTIRALMKINDWFIDSFCRECAFSFGLCCVTEQQKWRMKPHYKRASLFRMKYLPHDTDKIQVHTERITYIIMNISQDLFKNSLSYTWGFDSSFYPHVSGMAEKNQAGYSNVTAGYACQR